MTTSLVLSSLSQYSYGAPTVILLDPLYTPNLFSGNGYISGTAVGLNGAAVANVLVSVCDRISHFWLGNTHTDSTGAYIFQGMDPTLMFDVVFRDPTGTYEDVLVPRVTPTAYGATPAANTYGNIGASINASLAYTASPQFVGQGFFAGTSPSGLATYAGTTPAAVEIRCYESATKTLVAMTTSSAVNGTYLIDGLNEALTYDLVAHVPGNAWEDLITGRQTPMYHPLNKSGAVAATGMVGANLSTSLVAKYGKPPFSVSVTSGTAPAGITFSMSGRNLVATGTLTTATTYTYTLGITDSSSGSTSYSTSTVVSAASYGALSGIFQGPVANLYRSTTYTGQVYGVGGSGIYTAYSLISPPSGWSVSSVGVLSCSALPTAALTAPTQLLPLTVQVTDSTGTTATFTANVQLTRGLVSLLHFEGTNGGTTFTDEVGAVWTPGTSVTTSTTQAKAGSTSGSFPGSGTTAGLVNTAKPIAMGYNDWTIEGFFWQSTTSGSAEVLVGMNSSNGGIYVQSQKLVYFETSNRIVQSTTFTTSAWHHFALTKASGTITLWYDGTSLGTWPATTTTLYEIRYIGSDDASRNFAGFLDEVRMTMDTAIYTAPFTPPSVPFTPY